MVLDYRTVSTIHAIVFHNEGKFYLQDRRSSNGTMVYLQDPLELPFSHPIRLRMGRSTLTIQAKRNWLSSIREALNNARGGAVQHPTANELMNLLSISSTPPLPTTGAAATAQTPGLVGSPGTPALSPNSLATGSSQPTSPLTSANMHPNPFGFGQPTVRGTALLTPEQQQQQLLLQQQQLTASERYDTMPQEMGVYPRSYGMATNSQAMHRLAARQEAIDQQQQQQQQAALSSSSSPPMTGVNSNNNNSNNNPYFDVSGGEDSGVPLPQTTDLACGVLGNGMGGNGTKTWDKQPIQPTGGSQGQGLGQGAADGMISYDNIANYYPYFLVNTPVNDNPCL